MFLTVTVELITVRHLFLCGKQLFLTVTVELISKTHLFLCMREDCISTRWFWIWGSGFGIWF